MITNLYLAHFRQYFCSIGRLLLSRQTMLNVNWRERKRRQRWPPSMLTHVNFDKHQWWQTSIFQLYASSQLDIQKALFVSNESNVFGTKWGVILLIKETFFKRIWINPDISEKFRQEKMKDNAGTKQKHRYFTGCCYSWKHTARIDFK